MKLRPSIHTPPSNQSMKAGYDWLQVF